LEILLADDGVSEIMVNGPKKIYIESKGKLTLSEVTFLDDEHAMRVLYRIVAPLGRRIDESSPMVDARLPNGSRVNAVIRPISLIGPVITIRKFAKKPLGPEDLIRFGAVSRDMMDFLAACVKARVNTVVSGALALVKRPF
jgi:pilus assembly protein CpaF